MESQVPIVVPMSPAQPGPPLTLRSPESCGLLSPFGWARGRDAHFSELFSAWETEKGACTVQASVWPSERGGSEITHMEV